MLRSVRYVLHEDGDLIDNDKSSMYLSKETDILNKRNHLSNADSDPEEFTLTQAPSRSILMLPHCPQARARVF